MQPTAVPGYLFIRKATSLAMTLDDDSGMADMFRAELETHLATLNHGLLALEQDPREHQYFESLMRAAHSIKGAAKIVGISSAVRVAHEIEDCFVAARAGTLTLTSALVDLLLEGVDLLESVAQFAPTSATAEGLVEAYVTRIKRAINQEPPKESLPSTVNPISLGQTPMGRPVTVFRPVGA
ncbi:MAG TPA: Hpt domain-containing protein, partial [Pirellulaceae bacterium]